MAGYGGQGYNQDFYESGYDMDGLQQEVPPQTQQGVWQQQIPPSAPVQTHSQWSEAGQQAYYQPTSYSGHHAYGQQGKKLSRMTYCCALEYKCLLCMFLFGASLECEQ